MNRPSKPPGPFPWSGTSPGIRRFTTATRPRYGADSSMCEKIFRTAILLFLLLSPIPARGAESYLALCYHDIPEVASTPEDVPRHIFVKHIEYLRTHGFTFIGA